MELISNSRNVVEKYVDLIAKDITAHESGGKQLKLHALQRRLSKLDNFQKEAQQLWKDSLLCDNKETYDWEALMTKIDLLMDRISDSIEEQSTPEKVPRQHPEQMPLSSIYVKGLPQVQLPTFDGTPGEYHYFIKTFNELIGDDNSLSEAYKYRQLRTCLRGEALRTVVHHRFETGGYAHMIQRLEERFGNLRETFNLQIRKLFEFNEVTENDHAQVNRVCDDIRSIISCLRSIGSEAEIFHGIIINILMSKMSTSLNKEWNTQSTKSALPKWEDCVRVLEEQSSIERQSRKADNGVVQPVARVTKTALCNISCAYCKEEEHKVVNCEEFKCLTPEERRKHVSSLRLCFQCLQPGHVQRSCQLRIKCELCKGSHHTILHLEKAIMHPHKVTRNQASSFVTSDHTYLGLKGFTSVLLATALVDVEDRNGRRHRCTALLDMGSQVNIITDLLCRKLKLPLINAACKVSGVGLQSTSTQQGASVKICSMHNSFNFNLDCIIMKEIATPAICEWNRNSIELPANCILADPEFQKPKTFDLLLGAEAFAQCETERPVRKLKHGLSFKETEFGWVLYGKPSCSEIAKPVCGHVKVENIQLQLQRFWQLEETVSASNEMLPNPIENDYMRTTTLTDEGRVMVRLPFSQNSDTLGKSFNIARRRFLAVERRLIANQELYNQYVDFMIEYEKLGHMSQIVPHNGEARYYIPHHYVLKPSSTSTKLRVVFDASTKTSSGLSLNDVLVSGPTIQQELYMILLRFRTHRFAITADIVKMYRQFLIHPDDRKFQCILWRADASKDLQVYRLNTVTYGLSAAPYLAIRSLHYIADQYKDMHPMASNLVKSCFYVDDFLSGASTLKELNEIKTELTRLLRKGGLELDKWHSNHSEFRGQPCNKEVTHKDPDVVQALGIIWNQQSDTFTFASNNCKMIDNITKRTILAASAAIFDPIGLVGPITIVAKMILQEVWMLNLDWDDAIPQELRVNWLRLYGDLQRLSEIKVPRYVLLMTAICVEIHGFCDASLRAYGCCIYLRSIDSCGNVNVALYTAKSRVAPVKRKTLPQLELCGATLLAELLHKTNTITNINPSNVYLWSDSQIVLLWLTKHASTLSVFVGNRVAKIQELTNGCNWRHVPSRHNPADAISRGVTIDELQGSIWFTGPEFLKREPEF